MFANYTLNNVLFDEISLLLLPNTFHSSVQDLCHSFIFECIKWYIFKIFSQQTLPVASEQRALVVVYHKVHVSSESFAQPP